MPDDVPWTIGLETDAQGQRRSGERGNEVEQRCRNAGKVGERCAVAEREQEEGALEHRGRKPEEAA